MLLGRTSLEVFPFCLGGNVFGWTADRQQSFDVLDAFVAAGGDFIDTADVYSAWSPSNRGGESESILGEWISSRKNRDRVVIATKVAMHPERLGLSATNVRRACEDSLRRLRTDHIDLYYAHREDPDVPLVETMHAFDALVREGKVRHVAASQFSPERLREARAIERRDSIVGFSVLQTFYNALERGRFEPALRDVCRELGIAVLPFFGLARGYLSGKYRGGNPGESARADGALEFASARGERLLSTLEEIARAHAVSIAAVALAWLAAQPTIAMPLASARTPAQLAELLPAATLRLAPAELASITAATDE